MSHFYGWVVGSARTDATRCGNKSSGLVTRNQGWTAGVKVIAQHVDNYDGKGREADVFHIYLNNGSAYGSPDEKYLGKWVNLLGDDPERFWVPSEIDLPARLENRMINAGR